MKVFCTGATGFVGAHTALALLAAGHEPQLLVRDQKAARDWFEARGRRIGRFVTVDIRDQTALQHTMARLRRRLPRRGDCDTRPPQGAADI